MPHPKAFPHRSPCLIWWRQAFESTGEGLAQWKRALACRAALVQLISTDIYEHGDVCQHRYSAAAVGATEGQATCSASLRGVQAHVPAGAIRDIQAMPCWWDRYLEPLPRAFYCPGEMVQQGEPKAYTNVTLQGMY